MVSSSTTAASSPETRSARLAQSAGYFAAFIAMGMYGASLGPTLPGLAAQTGSGLSQVSILFSARAFGYLAGSVATGRLYDRLSGNRVMAVMLLLMMAGMVAAPAIALLPLLAIVFLFLGVTEAGVDVGGNTLIVWRHGARVGPFMNAMHFCYGVGAFVAPIVVAQAILRSGGITWAYRVLALLMLPAVIWMARTPSPRAPGRSRAGGAWRTPAVAGVPDRRDAFPLCGGRGELRRLGLHVCAQARHRHRRDRGLPDFGLLGRVDPREVGFHPDRWPASVQRRSCWATY